MYYIYANHASYSDHALSYSINVCVCVCSICSTLCMYYTHMYVQAVLASTVVIIIRSRDYYENVWLSKIYTLKNNLFTIRIQNLTTTLLVQHWHCNFIQRMLLTQSTNKF